MVWRWRGVLLSLHFVSDHNYEPVRRFLSPKYRWNTHWLWSGFSTHQGSRLYFTVRFSVTATTCISHRQVLQLYGIFVTDFLLLWVYMFVVWVGSTNMFFHTPHPSKCIWNIRNIPTSLTITSIKLSYTIFYSDSSIQKVFYWDVYGRHVLQTLHLLFYRIYICVGVSVCVEYYRKFAVHLHSCWYLQTTMAAWNMQQRSRGGTIHWGWMSQGL